MNDEALKMKIIRKTTIHISGSDVVSILMAHIRKSHNIDGMMVDKYRLSENGFSVDFCDDNTTTDLKLDGK